MKEAIELSLEYNKTYIKNKKLYLNFSISTIDLKNTKLNSKELKKLILTKIPKTDQEFFTISKFDKKSVDFVFDDILWFNKSIKQLKDTEDRFQKKLVLKPIPFIISNNSNSYEITKFIEGSFRNYLNKNKELKSKISNCIAQETPLVNFTFNFDGNILITLKQEFRHNIIAVLKSKKHKEIKKMDFDSSVYTLLKYNKKKK